MSPRFEALPTQLSAHEHGEPLLSAISKNGNLLSPVPKHSHLLEQCETLKATVRTIFLNRPAVLNALSIDMLSGLLHRIIALELSSSFQCIILRGKGPSGRAFCAGGDVRRQHEHGMRGDTAATVAFFRTEYLLMAKLARVRNVLVVPLLDGIVFGGGVGLFVHGEFRVATERTVFAMPECAIGLFPDIGASYFLPRLPGALGTFLALTGSRLHGAQLINTGLITHFIPSASLDDILGGILRAQPDSLQAVASALQPFVAKSANAEPIVGKSVIDRCFSAPTVEGIVSRLERLCKCSQASSEDVEFATKCLTPLRKASPTSLKIALRAQQLGVTQTLMQCLEMEFGLLVRAMHSHDFYAGVASMLVTKDRNPKWIPDTLSGVADDIVDKLFRPLEPELGEKPLSLDETGVSNDDVLSIASARL